MAVSTPMAAGNPLALAIPRLNGIANKNTRNPDKASAVQFCFSPSSPFITFYIIDLKSPFAFIFFPKRRESF
jgi:hypothetical protein